MLRVDLEGSVALVTGAGSGIGKAIARAFAASNAMVVVNDVAETGAKTAAKIHEDRGKAWFCQADVSVPGDVDKMVAEAESRFGRIDILVNNAGAGPKPEHRLPVHEFDHEEWRRLIDLDLSGTFYCTRAVSPRMVERRSGVIINISSIVGVVPIRRQIAYAAAKAGVVNFTRSAALELAPYGIRVNSIAPGSTLTPQTEAVFYNPEKKALADALLSHIPLGRPGTPDDIANAALFLAAPESAYITGTVLVVDGGWTAGFARDW